VSGRRSREEEGERYAGAIETWRESASCVVTKIESRGCLSACLVNLGKRNGGLMGN
jgi:hypothetical protein